MDKINVKDLHVKVSEKEGLKKQTDIAQIGEVTKHILWILANEHNLYQVAELLGRYKEK